MLAPLYADQPDAASQLHRSLAPVQHLVADLTGPHAVRALAHLAAAAVVVAHHAYPLLAKVVSHGIGLHEGRSFRLLNFWASAMFCVGIIFLCVTGPL